MESEKLRIDPYSPAYEAARGEMVKVLRQIGGEDSLNGYTQMADDLAVGNLMEVPTWIALALMATRAPADLRSALEAETIERCARHLRERAKSFRKAAFDQGKRVGPMASSFEYAAADIARLTDIIAALAPTKGEVS